MKSKTYSNGQIKRYLHSLHECLGSITEEEITGVASKYDRLLENETSLLLLGLVERRMGLEHSVTALLLATVCSAIRCEEAPIEVITFLNNNLCDFHQIGSLITQLRKKFVGQMSFMLEDDDFPFEASINRAKEMMSGG